MVEIIQICALPFPRWGSESKLQCIIVHQKQPKIDLLKDDKKGWACKNAGVGA